MCLLDFPLPLRERNPPFPLPPPLPPLHPTLISVGRSIFSPRALSSRSSGELERETQTSDREGSPGKFSMRSGGGAEEGAAGDAAQRGQQLTDTTRCVGCGRALPVLGVGGHPAHWGMTFPQFPLPASQYNERWGTLSSHSSCQLDGRWLVLSSRSSEKLDGRWRLGRSRWGCGSKGATTD